MKPAPVGERPDPSPPVLDDSLADIERGAISLGYMEGVIGFHLWLAQSIVERDLAPRLATIDLTPRQCALLELIHANPGASQVAFAGLIGTDRATMMGFVDRLEARGFVERRRSLEDRRRQELYVTPEGLGVLKLAEQQLVQNGMIFSDLFVEAEREQFVGFLKRMQGRRRRSPGGSAALGA